MNSPGKADKPRLIMVDDSRVMRSAAKKMLGGMFDVVVAEDGEEGWKQIKSDKTIKVVFTDLSMPNLDGYGLLQRIRTCDDGGIAGLPVIIVTGIENDDAAREKALELGATDFITKPFNLTDLTARAKAHASYQREKQALEQHTTIDVLTGLGNKEFFEARLKQDLAFSARHGNALSLVRFDVDRYNKVFIKVGKEVADDMLKQVAEVARTLIRKEDTAGRLSVSQFGILLPTAKEDGAAIFAERLLKKVESLPFKINGKAFPLTLSIGLITPEPHPGQTVRTVLEEAAIVLKAAQKKGSNCIVTPSSLDADTTPLPSRPEPPPTKSFSRKDSAVSIDDMLKRLSEGKQQEVIGALPAIRKKLAPLIKLIQSSQREKK